MSETRNPAELVEYRAEWAQRASALLRDVADATRDLPGGERAAFDHIGSTAVPGLAAKPFIDLQVRISPLPAEEDLIARLTPLRFERARGSRPDSPGVDRDLPRGSAEVAPEVWEKLLFWSEDAGAILHVRRADSPWGRYTVWFRDWLRADPAARERYQRVKHELSAQQVGKSDYDDYTRAKSLFFDEVQGEFEAWAAALPAHEETHRP